MEQESHQLDNPARTWRGLPVSTITSCLPSAKAVHHRFIRIQLPRGAGEMATSSLVPNMRGSAAVGSACSWPSNQPSATWFSAAVGADQGDLVAARWICAEKSFTKHFAVNLIVDVFPLKDDFAGTGSLLNKLRAAITSRRSPRSRHIAFSARTRLRYGSGAL